MLTVMIFRFIRSYFQGVIDRRKATKNGTGPEPAMLFGGRENSSERGLNIEKIKHRVLDGEQIRDERMANRRGSLIEAFGRGQIRESEETSHNILLCLFRGA